jgi:F-type H+-transporting ATPase subunit b
MSALISAFGIDWHLLFANAVNFIVLAALLTWLLYKPVMKMVAEREAVVAKGVHDAHAAAKKLEDAEGEAGRRISGAETEAVSIVDAARASATEEKARIVKDAEERAAQLSKDAEARAKEASAKALRESEKEIARLAILAAGKAMAEK